MPESTACCSSVQRASSSAGEGLSLEALTPIFGAAEDARSGLADFTESEREVLLSYHAYLADPADADREIGKDLAPKIRELYRRFKNVDRVAFGIALPNPGGEADWKSYVSFVMTRKLVDETEWSNFLDADLLRIAFDVRRTE